LKDVPTAIVGHEHTHLVYEARRDDEGVRSLETGGCPALTKRYSLAPCFALGGHILLNLIRATVYSCQASCVAILETVQADNASLPVLHDPDKAIARLRSQRIYDRLGHRDFMLISELALGFNNRSSLALTDDSVFNHSSGPLLIAVFRF
jgi:hypothetical protein